MVQVSTLRTTLPTTRGRIFRQFTSGAFRIHLRKFPENSGFTKHWSGKMAVLGLKTSKFQKIRVFRPVFFRDFPDYPPNLSGTFPDCPQNIPGKCRFLHHSRRSRRRYDPYYIVDGGFHHFRHFPPDLPVSSTLAISPGTIARLASKRKS